jgi:NTP pyrophosphatase (non-canonical NTP hydrolase)
LHIRKFQEMMRSLYFHRDSDRGVKGTYKWLLDEVEELGDALNGASKEELEKEFADVIAWLASLANITSVDLERAAITKYDYKCPKCKRLPCKCKF